MSHAFLLVFLLLLLLFIIIISGVEYAYLAANKLTIELKRKQGTKSGRLLGGFFDAPETFWNGTVIGFYILLVCFCFLFCRLMGQLGGRPGNDGNVDEQLFQQARHYQIPAFYL